MAENLPSLGADIVLEFQQSINNINMFGQAMETLDSRFGSIERRVDSLRSSLSSLSTQASRGGGKDLRAEMERELNNLVAGNGVVLNNVGTMPLKVSQKTVREVFSKAESLINQKLAESFKDITIQVDPGLNNGKVVIKDDEFKEVNKAIARLVRTQLDNLVAAIRKQGADLVSAEDMKSLQMHIGKGTAQQIINKIKQELTKVILNPQINTNDLKLAFSEKELNRLMNQINSKVKDSLDKSVAEVAGSKKVESLTPRLKQVYDQIDTSVAKYMQNLNVGLSSMDAGTIKTPFEQLAKQTKRFIAKEMGEDISKVSEALRGMQMTSSEVSMSELRRHFSRLEQVLNKKLQGGVQQQIKELIAQVEVVDLKPDTKLKYHITSQINRVNNAIVKKVREQVDKQFNHLMAEVNSINTDPKNMNRSGRLRQGSRTLYNDTFPVQSRQESPKQSRSTMINDPYSRRDNYFNGTGIEGAVTNTLRHIVAGGIVGAPMMLLYNSMEQYKTSQLEQLKMFSNLFAQNISNSDERAKQGDTREAGEIARGTVKELIPYTKEAAQVYSIEYGQMSEVTSVGSRLLDTTGEIKRFTNTVSQIFNIDREGDPVNVIAPGLEAFMGQFDLAVGELHDSVVKPLAVATNVTNATTEGIMQALMRSGSTFKAAGVSPEDAIAMVATSIKYTGLSGENTGNFYKSILPRLQAPETLKTLDSIGVQVYKDDSKVNVKSADEILQEVADKYHTLTDSASRDVIMKMFGTYQSAKGATTLDEFDEFVSIKKTMDKFSDEQFNQLMANNTTAPIMEIQRAGISAQIAITSILEEMTPTIVAVSQGITSLSNGLVEYKEELAGLMRFLGMALLGYAAKWGVQKAWTASNGPASVARMETRDKLIGNASLIGAWQRTGTLSSLQGVNGINPSILQNTKENRAFMNQALQNPVLEERLRTLANMTDEEIKTMKSYVQSNNLLVKDMKDLLHVAEESKGHVERKPLTDVERQNLSAYNAGKIYDKNLSGVSESFSNDLSGQLRDQSQFAAIAQTRNGGKVVDFLSRMDDAEMGKFRQHLDDVHKTSGKVITDFDGLSDAVDSYQAKQIKARESVRGTSPDMVQMSDAIDKVNKQIDNSESRMKKFDSFLGGLSTKARGGASALGGLAKTIGGLAGQMVLLAGVGEFMSDIAYINTASAEEKNLNKATKDVKDQDKALEIFSGFEKNGGTWGESWNYLGDSIAKGFLSIGDFFSPTDKYFDIKEANAIKQQLYEFAKEKYGTTLTADDAEDPSLFAAFGEHEKKFVSELKEKGLTVEQVLSEMNQSNGKESVNEVYKNAQIEAFKQRQAQMEEDERDLRQVSEAVERTKKDRIRKELLHGQYQTYDLATVKENITSQAKDINTETANKSLVKVMDDGLATDSDEYIKMRTEQSQKIIDLYQNEIDKIKEFIKNSELELEQAELIGLDPEQIKALQDRIGSWKKSLEEVEPEFNQKILEQRKAQMEENANAKMNSASYDANRRTLNANTADTLNAVSMDRNSLDYINSTRDNAQERINAYQDQIKELEEIETTPDQQKDIDMQIDSLKGQIAQEQLNIKELRLQSIGIYRQDMQDNLTQMSNEFMKAQVEAGTSGENTPELNKLRIDQYKEQVGMFDEQIAELQQRYDVTDDEEERKALKRELIDLERQRFQAQLGIIDAKMAQITMYRVDMQDRLSTLDANYAVAQADSKVINDSSDPKLRALKEKQLKSQVAEYDQQIADQEARLPGASEEETKQINRELNDLKKARAQAQLSIQNMRLTSIGLYREDMNAELDEMDVNYMKKKVDTGITDESNPILRNFRVNQYNEQVGIFTEEIAKLQARLPDAQTDEEAKALQQEIRDLQKQQYQAQLGILDEMKNTGGTFNLPDGVKAMTYYEYMTRNNTHSTYTVQGGDTNVQITLPNVTDGTSAEKLKTIGKSIGEGINEGSRLRPQMLANPYGYRTPV